MTENCPTTAILVALSGAGMLSLEEECFSIEYNIFVVKKKSHLNELASTRDSQNTGFRTVSANAMYCCPSELDL